MWPFPNPLEASRRWAAARRLLWSPAATCTSPTEAAAYTSSITGPVAWCARCRNIRAGPTRYRAQRRCWRTAFWSSRRSRRASVPSTIAPICWPKPRNPRPPLESEAGQASNDDFDAVTGRYDGVIYIGTLPNEEHEAVGSKYQCCSFVGRMSAVDLKTGKVIWQTPMAPKGYTGAPSGVAHRRSIPSAAWFTLPPVTTTHAQGSGGVPGRRQTRRLPIDDHIDSFVPLDRKTGAIKWAN
jgi:hypothetical protein